MYLIFTHIKCLFSGSHLVLKAIKAMIADDCDEVTVSLIDSFKYNCLKKMHHHMLVLEFPRNDG